MDIWILSKEWLINNRNLFLKVLKAGKSKSKMLVDLVSGECMLPSLYTPIFLLSSLVGRDKEALWGLFYKGTNPILEGSTPMT